MKGKNYFYILLEIIVGFSICYSICIIPFFYFLYPKFFDTFGKDFILSLQIFIFFIFVMLIFSFPCFILLALVRFSLNNKISYFINFVLFEIYGYFLFVYLMKDNKYAIIQSESLLYVLHKKYFIYSIPMTCIFLFIVFMINNKFVGVKINDKDISHEK